MELLLVLVLTIALTAQALKCVKVLRDLQETHANAVVTITAICTETTIISASLSQIQSVLLAKLESVSHELFPALDIALVGCTVTFSCIDKELAKLKDSDSASGS